MNFEFDQLGIEIAPGVFGGSYDGRAEICFEEYPGDFYIASIEVDGLIEGGVRKSVLLDVPAKFDLLSTWKQHLARQLEQALIAEHSSDICSQGRLDGAHNWPTSSMDMHEHRLTARELGVSRVAL